jgi:hypothetical protein
VARLLAALLLAALARTLVLPLGLVVPAALVLLLIGIVHELNSTGTIAYR